MRRITREPGHTAKTLDTSREQNDGYIEGPKMSEEPAAAPALPIDIILPRLELFYSPGNICKLFSGDPDFRCPNSDVIRTVYVRDIPESRPNIPVSINKLTREFDCPRFPVQAALWHKLDEPGNEECMPSSTTMVNSASSIESDSTQDNTCQSRGEKLWIIAQLNPRSNSPEDGDVLRRQKMCQLASGAVLSIGSCDLHANGFFIGNDDESLFYF
jgi:hypothetical protein